jgi:hypothetical protein
MNEDMLNNTLELWTIYSRSVVCVNVAEFSCRKMKCRGFDSR